MHNNLIILAVIGGCVLLVAFIIGFMFLRHPKKLDSAIFSGRWKKVESQCRSETTWPLAVLDADKILDDALKKLRYRGKTMGERLVAAQRSLTDNDSVWFGHKLRNKIAHEEMDTLKKKDVQSALRGFRQALRDLGALK